MLPQWSLPGAQPRGSTPEQSQRRAVVIFMCAPMPERVLDDKVEKLVLLFLLVFFPNKHRAASGQLLFLRGDMYPLKTSTSP